MQDTQTKTIRKSVRLTKEQKSQLKSFVTSFHTRTEAAESIGISRQVLDRVMIVHSGRADNIQTILSKIQVGSAA